jgi:hypothetical protein
MEALRRQVEQLTATVSQLNATVQSQAQRINQLEQGAQTQTAMAQPPTPPSSKAQQAGGTNLSAFNPEIGVIADVVAQASESSEDGEGNDKLSAREVEVIFGHAIDPYSRLDVTATFSDFEDAGLEEAYVTHWGLPGEIKARLGRLRPLVGKASPIHRDSLDTVDEPLVVAQYLGAEGLSRTAGELSWFAPAPWTTVTHQVTGGVMEGGVGEGATLFGETRRRPSYYAHLKNFWEISDVTNAELGTTYLAGSKDADSGYEVHALGVDATLVHYLTPNNKVKWQNELYVQKRAEAYEDAISDDDPSVVTRTLFHESPWGLYSLLDVRLTPRVGVGGRFDYVEPIDTDPALMVRGGDTAWSAYATFYQSEFARWRLQARHTDFALGGDDNTFFLQGTFAIGVHKHQIQ